uniref:TBP-binding domain-containing protein n=1 Tax=Parastrongyloides trichosuri TaxID=131310 RepID=A0A0N4Z2S1_PARTI
MEEMFELDMDTESVPQYGNGLKTGVKDGLDLSYKEGDDILYPLPSDKTRSQQTDPDFDLADILESSWTEDDNSNSRSSLYASDEDNNKKNQETDFAAHENATPVPSNTTNNFRQRADTTPTSVDPIVIGNKRKTSRAEHIAKPVVGENNQIDIFASMKSESLSLYAKDHPIAIFGERPTDTNDAYSPHTLTSGARKVFTSTSYCPSSFIHR